MVSGRVRWLGMAIAVAASACFDPILPKECPDRVCTQGAGGSTDAGTKEPPYPCACASCASSHDCQKNCQRPAELNACWYPQDGCVVMQGDCPQHGG